MLKQKTMKNIILTLAISMVATLSFGQVSVEGININELDIKYCQLVGYNKSLFGQNIIVTIDYGQEFKLFKTQLIKNHEGKAVEFNSMVDALNFMENNGWVYTNNYAVSVGNSSVYHYLLRRKEEAPD